MVEEKDGPQRISDIPLRGIDITGYLLPVIGKDRPVLLNITGTGAFYLPIFTTSEKLHNILDGTVGPKIHYDSIKQITNQHEFMAEIPEDIHIIVDLRPHDDPMKKGKFRWTELFR